DIARCVHGIDDDALTDGNALHRVPHRDHLARSLMADGRDAARLSMNAADLDIGEIAPADTAGLHFDDHIRVSGTRRFDGIQPDVVDSVNVQNAAHGICSLSPTKSPDQRLTRKAPSITSVSPLWNEEASLARYAATASKSAV